MPQLDILTYFSQYLYLIISFFSIYYFAITFILPSTLTAEKLRAKCNQLAAYLAALPTHLKNPQDLAFGSPAIMSPVVSRENYLADLLADAYNQLEQNSLMTTSVSDFQVLTKKMPSNPKECYTTQLTRELGRKKKQLLDQPQGQ